MISKKQRSARYTSDQKYISYIYIYVIGDNFTPNSLQFDSLFNLQYYTG